MAGERMESLDLLNLRAGECSFLEIVLIDVRRFVETSSLENKKQVLVFPPLCARNRFLIHTLVQNFFHELNTISIGSSYGRRTVVYHSSIKPMINETELDESNVIRDENSTCMDRAYRTPNERKAQEKLFHSLMPKKNVDKISRSTQRKQCKRPDIPIYIPKALRVTTNNVISNISSNTDSSFLTTSNKPDINTKTQDDNSDSLYSKEMKSSLLAYHNNYHNNYALTLLDSYKFVDLSNEMRDNVNKEFQTSCNNVTPQISESFNNVSNVVNIDEHKINSFISNDLINRKSSTLDHVGSESNITLTISSNDDNVSTASDFAQCLSDNTNSTYVQNVMLSNSFNNQILDVDNEIIADKELKLHVTKPSTESITLNNIGETVNKNLIDMSNKQQNETVVELTKENYTNCHCLDDSFSDEILTNIVENISYSNNEELNVSQSSIPVNTFLENCENNEKKNEIKKKKKKKKKVLNVEECSWEDLYNKDDDYIHPLLMKELISTMGKVQVQCTKENYRNHQTIEERSGDGECVIEVYGFSSELKTIDLMNQFAAFRNKGFEIVWVNDTHALAVFESPNLADRALNTPFALVKTRPLKNAIKESKLKAETIAPLPATRPKTCTAMARRLVTSALGLKVNVSPDILNEERKLLKNAKEKKIRDAQQKHDVWNNES